MSVKGFEAVGASSHPGARRQTEIFGIGRCVIFQAVDSRPNVDCPRDFFSAGLVWLRLASLDGEPGNAIGRFLNRRHFPARRPGLRLFHVGLSVLHCTKSSMDPHLTAARKIMVFCSAIYPTPTLGHSLCFTVSRASTSAYPPVSVKINASGTEMNNEKSRCATVFERKINGELRKRA